MTRGAGHVALLPVALAALAAIAWPGRAHAASGLRASPSVAVIDAGTAGPASDTIAVHNDSTTTVAASAIVAEAGCDPAVQLTPLGAFNLSPGATQTLTVACAAATAEVPLTGMQRCRYQVQSAASATLLEFEAVCAYAGDASLMPDTTAIDFGGVPVGGRASHAVTITNLSTAPIQQLSVEVDDLAGDFSVAAPCNPDARECDAPVRTIAPNATARVIVNCTPRSAAALGGTLHLVSSAGTRLTAPISLTCTGTDATAPVLSVVPESIDVGAVAVNVGKAAAAFHVTNAGGMPLRLLAAAILDGGTGAASEWAIAPHAPCGLTIPPSCLVNPHDALDLDISFAPRTLGQRDATLLLSYHDVADRSISLPLHGSGSGPTWAVLGGFTTLDFGSLPINTPGTLTLQLANRGTRALTDASITVTPATGFSINPAENFAIETAGTTPLTVTCQPPGVGPFIAKLTFSAADVPELPAPINLRCAGGTGQVLAASPPAALLGEVRTNTAEPAAMASLAVSSQGEALTLTSAALEVPIAGVTVRVVTPTTRAMLQLTAKPTTDGSLDDRIVVTASTGAVLDIPISGTAVTAAYTAPPPLSLGTFCVDQATAPRLLSLINSGSATLGISAPALDNSDSPFDLAPVSPLVYPNALAPGGQATVSVTPKRQSTAGLASDSVVWTTDGADNRTASTPLTATFVDDGGAIHPNLLDFHDVMIQVSTPNAQQVALQNCSSSVLQLDAPQVPAPFSIDSPSFPSALRSGETVTFSIGFHPTQPGKVVKTLAITSPQLTMALTVSLTGNGMASGGGTDDAGVGTTGQDRTSFYACGGCATGSPSSVLAMALAVLGALAPRRRRRHRR